MLVHMQRPKEDLLVDFGVRLVSTSSNNFPCLVPHSIGLQSYSVILKFLGGNRGFNSSPHAGTASAFTDQFSKLL